MNLGPLLPPLGDSIRCPCCDRPIPALVLTNAYLCPHHGLFEVGSAENEVIHLDSGRRWLSWQNRWFFQHQQIESLRAEILAALEHLHHQGCHATEITLPERYRDLITPYLESGSDWFHQIYFGKPRLYGLPVTFQAETPADSRWQIIAFEFTKALGPPKTYTYLSCTRISKSERK